MLNQPTIDMDGSSIGFLLELSSQARARSKRLQRVICFTRSAPCLKFLLQSDYNDIKMPVPLREKTATSLSSSQKTISDTHTCIQPTYDAKSLVKHGSLKLAVLAQTIQSLLHVASATLQGLGESFAQVSSIVPATVVMIEQSGILIHPKQ